MNKESRNEIGDFFLRHGFAIPYGDVHTMTDELVRYMSGTTMLQTYLTPSRSAPKTGSVIVIDAGGTNFRSCMVTFGNGNVPVITELQKCAMPGAGKELTAAQFYGAIADNVERLKGKSSTIALCFSYALEMLSSGDARVIKFSKEIKASAVIGTLLGQNLAAALRERGWGEVAIRIVNDTAAALVAGSVFGESSTRPSSYASFILGTGINSAFLNSGGKVVVTEIGSYGNVPMSDFDKEVDDASTGRGTYLLEKQCSGAYLGRVASSMLRHAAAEGLLANSTANQDGAQLTLFDVDKFLHSPFDDDNLSIDEHDREVLFALFDAVAARSAVLSAAVISASVLKAAESAGGLAATALHPISVEVNGTTFDKTYKLRHRVEAILEMELCARRGVYWEMTSVKNDITLGTAAAY